ncbi:UDP-3-O-(3-hydroxymyristoyl)glucosamine N-acyltransferase [Maricaulis sp. CAU 1757]
MVAETRFFDRLGPLSLNEIAALSGAAISDSGSGNGEISDAAPISELSPGALAFADNRAALTTIPDGVTGGCVIVPTDAAQELAGSGHAVLTHAQPKGAFAVALGHLFSVRTATGDVAIHPDAEIADDAMIGPGVVVGAGARIGRGVRLAANAYVGPGCVIGAGTSIGAGAVIQCADLGEDCNILAAAVIGEAGFGVALSNRRAVDMPHLGCVKLGDRVTVGANSTIDRGVFGATRIGEGTKIDNLCHIGHNVSVGRNCMFAAFAGVSGSTTIGDYVMFGGRVGVADHLNIGDRARLGANAAVMTDVPEDGVWAGAPAQPIRQFMREVASLRRLAQGAKKTRNKD